MTTPTQLPQPADNDWRVAGIACDGRRLITPLPGGSAAASPPNSIPTRGAEVPLQAAPPSCSMAFGRSDLPHRTIFLTLPAIQKKRRPRRLFLSRWVRISTDDADAKFGRTETG